MTRSANRIRGLVWCVMGAGLLVCGGAAYGQASHIYEFDVVNSVLDVEAEVSVSGITDSDSDSSPVSGTITAELWPAFGEVTQIHITGFDLAFDETINMQFGSSPFVVNATGEDLALLMPGEEGSAGGLASVSGGSFTQTGNVVESAGQITLSGLISEQHSLDGETMEADLANGTISTAGLGDLLELNIPVNVQQDLEDDDISATVTFTGNILGQAVAVPEPSTLLLLGSMGALGLMRRRW